MTGRISERPDLSRFVLFGAVAYVVLAQGAFAPVRRASLLGIPQRVLQGVLLAIAAITFIVIAAVVARHEGPDWWKRTLFTSVYSAGLAALAYGALFAIRVRGGAACNQCKPILFTISISVSAVVVAAIGATIVGYVARRTRRVRVKPPVV